MAIFANMKRIILITGGERSGKSVYAEQLALRLSEQPVYMATARIWDEEFRQRVRIHRERRGAQWTNIEEEKIPEPSRLDGTDGTGGLCHTMDHEFLFSTIRHSRDLRSRIPPTPWKADRLKPESGKWRRRCKP